MLKERVAGVAGLSAAILAATCCIIPILLIATGVAGAGLMMTMMRYEWFTLPIGVLGVIGGGVLYVRQQRQCSTDGCKFVGQRANQILLAVAGVIILGALLLRLFPSWTSWLLLRL